MSPSRQQTLVRRQCLARAECRRAECHTPPRLSLSSLRGGDRSARLRRTGEACKALVYITLHQIPLFDMTHPFAARGVQGARRDGGAHARRRGRDQLRPRRAGPAARILRRPRGRRGACCRVSRSASRLAAEPPRGRMRRSRRSRARAKNVVRGETRALLSHLAAAVAGGGGARRARTRSPRRRCLTRAAAVALLAGRASPSRRVSVARARCSSSSPRRALRRARSSSSSAAKPAAMAPRW